MITIREIGIIKNKQCLPLMLIFQKCILFVICEVDLREKKPILFDTYLIFFEKFVLDDQIKNKPPLVQVMAWNWTWELIHVSFYLVARWYYK